MVPPSDMAFSTKDVTEPVARNPPPTSKRQTCSQQSNHSLGKGEMGRSANTLVPIYSMANDIKDGTRKSRGPTASCSHCSHAAARGMRYCATSRKLLLSLLFQSFSWSPIISYRVLMGLLYVVPPFCCTVAARTVNVRQHHSQLDRQRPIGSNRDETYVRVRPLLRFEYSNA